MKGDYIAIYFSSMPADKTGFYCDPVPFTCSDASTAYIVLLTWEEYQARLLTPKETVLFDAAPDKMKRIDGANKYPRHCFGVGCDYRLSEGQEIAA